MSTFRFKKPRSAMPPPTVFGAVWVPLTKGAFALVDEADEDFVFQHPWSLDADGYAVASFKGDDGKWRLKKMHRVLTGAITGLEVDHVNGNRLDNRRANLRICTRKQNGRNLKKTRGKSRFKGVQKTEASTYRALIKVDGVMRHVGTFQREEEAAVAYNEAARRFYGEYACLNRF